MTFSDPSLDYLGTSAQPNATQPTPQNPTPIARGGSNQMTPFAQFAMGRNPGLSMMLGQLGVKGLPSFSNPSGGDYSSVSNQPSVPPGTSGTKSPIGGTAWGAGMMNAAASPNRF